MRGVEPVDLSAGYKIGRCRNLPDADFVDRWGEAEVVAAAEDGVDCMFGCSCCGRVAAFVPW